MPIVSISATYPIRKASNSNLMPGSSEVTLSIDSSGQSVAVSILGQERFARALIQQFTISDSLIGWINSSPRHINFYPPEQAEEIGSVAMRLEASARAVVEAIKYLFNRPDLPDNVLGLAAEFNYVDEADQRHEIPIPKSSYMTVHSRVPLGGKAAIDLQFGLDAGYRPLAGMRHLFRAMQEDEPRFRWIDTTIALELAIKEALIRKRPEIETLLLEMPSPPLEKLYGLIMKETFGVASPQIKAIREGAAKRNRLVHRPMGVVVTREEAAEYLRAAHQAIHHLFSMLYPEWPIAHQMTMMTFHG